MSNENDIDINGKVGIMKWVPTIMLVSVVSGFVMVAFYAYHSGTTPVKEEELLVIEAEKEPIKEQPLDPGGMKFPNQDKTIFETFSSAPPQAKVERVLPSPEEPIVNDTTSNIPTQNPTDSNDKPAIESVTEPASGNSASRISFDDNVGGKQNEDAQKQESPQESPVVEVEKIEAVGVDDKKPKVIKVADSKTEEIKPADVKPKASEAKNTIQPAAVKSPEKSTQKSGGAKIQLGAFASESEAKETWQKIQKKFPSLSSRTPIIVRADIKGKTFYRLRLGGFSDKESAKEMCKNLTAKGQGCLLPVGS